MSGFDEFIIESINRALLVPDRSFRVVRSNQRLRDVFRLEPGDGVNTPLRQVFPDGSLETIVRQEIAAEYTLRELDPAVRIDMEKILSEARRASGIATNPAARKLINETGSPMLPKPFTLDDLASAVRQVIVTRATAGI